ncbi:MAG: hypothetical protein ABFD60_01590 [Bryobacteraceae bacterium]
MANYSSANVTIQIKDHSGTLRTFTAFVRSIGGVSIEAILQEAHTMGSTWFAYLFAGIKKCAPITFGGFYDDAANGPDSLFAGQEGETRTGTVIGWGGSKTTTTDILIQKYDRGVKLGALTEFTVTLQPSGAVSEA